MPAGDETTHPELNTMIIPNRRRSVYINIFGGYVLIGIVSISGFLLIPMYIDFIGQRLYGAWVGSGDILAWLGILDMGLGSLMSQRIASAYGKNDRRLVGEYFAAGLLSMVILIVLLVICASILSTHIAQWMNLTGQDATDLAMGFVLAACGTGIGIFNNGLVAFANALQRPATSNAVATIGALVRVFITIVLLTIGWGLLAIPIALVTSNGFSAFINGAYAVFLYRRLIYTRFIPSKSVLRDFATLSPAIFISKIGNAVMGNSAAFLIAIFLKPELAAVYAITRRLADVVQLLLDRIGGAVFPAFAHLVTSEQQKESVRIHHEITGFYILLAIAGASVYIAINQTLINLWVGLDQFGGMPLTIVIGLNMLVSGLASLILYLYSASGHIVASSYLVLLESCIQIPLMFVLLPLFGMSGLPIANGSTSMIAGIVAYRQTMQTLPTYLISGPQINFGYIAMIISILGVGCLLGMIIWAESWLGLLLGTGIFSLIVGILLIWVDTPVSGIIRLKFKTLFSHSVA